MFQNDSFAQEQKLQSNGVLTLNLIKKIFVHRGKTSCQKLNSFSSYKKNLFTWVGCTAPCMLEGFKASLFFFLDIVKLCFMEEFV